MLPVLISGDNATPQSEYNGRCNACFLTLSSQVGFGDRVNVTGCGIEGAMRTHHLGPCTDHRWIGLGAC